MRSGVYVLALRYGGYYVGKSANVDARVLQHLSGQGSAWCAYRGGAAAEVPLVHAGSAGDLSAWEMNETVSQMLLHGFNNVRGWEFSGCAALTTSELDTIRTIVMGQTDACRKCGLAGHFAGACAAPEAKAPWLAALEALRADSVSAPAAGAAGMSAAAACVDSARSGGGGRGAGRGGWGAGARSGRGGRGGRGAGGAARGARARGVIVKKPPPPRKTLFCTRCGRDTHAASSCFARFGVDGRELRDADSDADSGEDRDADSDEDGDEE